MASAKAGESGQPTDYTVGTVTSASPLEITIDATQAALKELVLILTDMVREKKITITGIGEVTIIPALSAGEKVIMLRVQHGQKYLVLSRVGGSS